jgi:hypothetical protein
MLLSTPVYASRRMTSHISEQEVHDAGQRIDMFACTLPGRLAVSSSGNQAADLQTLTTAVAAWELAV